MDAPEAPNAVSLLALSFSGGVAALVAWFERRSRKREPAEPTTPNQVVAATFTERGQMERLTTALVSVERAVTASNEKTGELVDLLQAEAQRRHDEAIVRQALRDRGIIEP